MQLLSTESFVGKKVAVVDSATFIARTISVSDISDPPGLSEEDAIGALNKVRARLSNSDKIVIHEIIDTPWNICVFQTPNGQEKISSISVELCPSNISPGDKLEIITPEDYMAMEEGMTESRADNLLAQIARHLGSTHGRLVKKSETEGVETYVVKTRYGNMEVCSKFMKKSPQDLQ